MSSERAFSPSSTSLHLLRLLTQHGPLTTARLDDLMADAGYPPTTTSNTIERLLSHGRIVRHLRGYRITPKGESVLISFDAGATLRAQAEAKRAARQAVSL